MNAWPASVAGGPRRFSDGDRAPRTKAALVVLPTGHGKYELAAAFALRTRQRALYIVQSDGDVWPVTDAIERLAPEQTSAVYDGPGHSYSTDVVVASEPRLRAAIRTSCLSHGDFDCVVIDDVRADLAERYMELFDHLEPEFLLGITRSPETASDHRIAVLFRRNVIHGVAALEGIERGLLAPFRYHALRDSVDYGSLQQDGLRYAPRDLDEALSADDRTDAIIDRYRSLTGEARAIAFCNSPEHAERAAARFRLSGIPSVAVHHDLGDDERRLRTNAFRIGRAKVAFVRDLFDEAADVLEVGALLLLRPCSSRADFVQRIARGLQPCPERPLVLVLDFVGDRLYTGQIPDYLAALGCKLTWPALRQTPDVAFGNGCAVRFEPTVFQAMSAPSPEVPSEGALIDEFFLLYGYLGRTPTLAELLSTERSAVGYYLARFGTWSRFIERVRHREPALDAEALAWPERLQDMTAQEISTFFDDHSVEFQTLVQDAEVVLTDVTVAFDALADPLPTRRSQEALRRRLELFDDTIDQASRTVAEIALILTFRGLGRAHVDVPAPDASRKEISEAIAKRLADASGRREAYLLPRLFAAKRGVVERLASLAAEHRSRDRANKADLAAVLAHARVVANILSDCRAYLARLLDAV